MIAARLKPLGLVLLLMPCLLGGCQGFHSSLDPAGPMSGQIYHVMKIFLWVSVVVYVLVVICSIVAILRMRSRVDLRNDPIFMPTPESNRPQNRVIAALVVLTAVILFGLMLVDFLAGQKIHAFAGSEEQLGITVTGHQWWWEGEDQDATPSTSALRA